MLAVEAGREDHVLVGALRVDGCDANSVAELQLTGLVVADERGDSVRVSAEAPCLEHQGDRSGPPTLSDLRPVLELTAVVKTPVLLDRVGDQLECTLLCRSLHVPGERVKTFVVDFGESTTGSAAGDEENLAVLVAVVCHFLWNGEVI